MRCSSDLEVHLWVHPPIPQTKRPAPHQKFPRGTGLLHNARYRIRTCGLWLRRAIRPLVTGYTGSHRLRNHPKSLGLGRRRSLAHDALSRLSLAQPYDSRRAAARPAPGASSPSDGLVRAGRRPRCLPGHAVLLQQAGFQDGSSLKWSSSLKPPEYWARLNDRIVSELRRHAQPPSAVEAPAAPTEEQIATAEPALKVDRPIPGIVTAKASSDTVGTATSDLGALRRAPERGPGGVAMNVRGYH
jgi:hypothetical protein